MMVNPVQSAAECFLAVFNNLPLAIRALANLSLMLLVVGAIVSFLWHIK